MNKVGYNIRSLRKGLKLTQVELSEIANVSSQVVSNWERGYSTLSTDDLAKLMEIFNVPAELILGADYVLPTSTNTIEEVEEQRDKNELVEFIRSTKHENVKVLLDVSKYMKNE